MPREEDSFCVSNMPYLFQIEQVIRNVVSAELTVLFFLDTFRHINDQDVVVADQSTIVEVGKFRNVFAMEVKNSPTEISQINHNDAFFTAFQREIIQRVAAVTDLKPSFRFIRGNRRERDYHISNS